ncbi:MAG: alpha-galactosidase [Clostridia bacterium]|nr:alpha-galactosidase [Clostridia bacterium]
MVSFHKETQTFYLETKRSSYVMRLLPNGMLHHVYYGARIARDDLCGYHLFVARELSPDVALDGVIASPDTIQQEYPCVGRGDYREPAVIVQTPDGRRVNELAYESHRIVNGKPLLPGLPQLKPDETQAQTLEITLYDRVCGFEVCLSYTVFEEENVIARHSRITNRTAEPLYLLRAASASVDLRSVADFDVLTLDGTWARERAIHRRPLAPGMTVIGGRRGASGHQHNPFVALLDRHATEDAGDVYGCVLVYSGDCCIGVEVDAFEMTRLQIGISPDTFTWKVLPQETFTTPEALLVYSPNGLNGMSQSYHAACRRYLGRCADGQLSHPVVINNWEAMYFSLNEEKMTQFIRNCAGLGIDTVVMDDGWFGHRNSDRSSLGDWYINREKFPNGLQGVIDVCHEQGMNFGIWLEPEMISRDSDLFRAHPDWCIHSPGREPMESRHQLVLDMTRGEVVDYLYAVISELLSIYDISYVKWDMNRNITDNGSDWLEPDRQGEFNHRYILGVYELMRRLVTAFPQVVFEGCSSGGGRFDFGLLYYMSQIWTSDDSDAIERLKIQYGTSLVYPPSCMTAHVSACPNHQTGRAVPFKTRGDIAQMFSFGYELDVGLLPEAEKQQIREQTASHRTRESLINDGTFYRLRSPFEGNYCAWELVSPDLDRACVMLAQQTAEPACPGTFLQLRGLDPERRYTVLPLDKQFAGSTLMNAGLPILFLAQDHGTVILDLVSE